MGVERLRSGAALVAARAVSSASRLAGLGCGSTVGGSVALAIEPRLLARLGSGRRTVLVSGTNGKTTTTRLLAEAIARLGPVATSAAGANLPPGIVAALAGAPDAPFAVLEVDEGYLGRLAAELSPEVIVLLNLSRDQLDRVSEVRKVARRWREALAGFAGVVVANADDPLVSWAASAAREVRFVGAGGLWHGDAFHCPVCGSRLALEGAAWSCRCGFSRPELGARLDGEELELAGGRRLRLELGLPGRFNLANAALAVVAADALGLSPEAAIDAMGAVREVAGRFARSRVGAAEVQLLLAKNPAGWGELLELVAGGTTPVVIGINARIADGRDPSWLWDVPFEVLAGRPVIATGDRRRDLAVRLRHAGVDHRVADDPLDAISSLAGELHYIGNYTAFQQLRRRLARSRAPAAGARPPASAATGTSPARGHPAPAPAPATATAKAKAAGPARRESTLRVVLVHPDLLGTYGDGGNARVLVSRALWRGVAAELVLAASDRPLPRGGDLYVLGGGEDGPQSHSAAVLAKEGLAEALEAGATLLAVCAGYQILGRSFPGPDGKPQPGVGLLDVDTVLTGERRAVGEVLLAEAAGPADARPALLTGFENHAGRTKRGAGVSPLGEVRAGTGNGDGTDGARAGKVVCTYLHGPVLARNPALADELLVLATGLELGPLEDGEEEALRRERLAAVSRRRR